jgi:hypothetical protein
MARCRTCSLHVKASVAFNSQSVTGTEFGYGDTELGVKYRSSLQATLTGGPNSPFIRWCLHRLAMPREAWEAVPYMLICRFGHKRILASGQPMAAADTGLTQAQVTGIIGSWGGKFSGKSPTI